MSTKNTQMDGDLSVGRNVAIGGDTTTQGSSLVKKNLTVEGWLEAKNLKTVNKGMFSNEGELKAEYPNPENGWWALVGDFPPYVYIVKEGEWVNTNKTADNIEIDGGDIDITNNPDEEDITSEEASNGITVLKFKDKNHDAANFSGLGRVYLRKNMQDGKNVLTQSMINSANTRYIIQYDYDLNGESITIPDNCVLVFDGGSISNGTIFCSEIYISNRNNFFFKHIALKGKILNDVIKANWFSLKKSNEGNFFLTILTIC